MCISFRIVTPPDQPPERLPHRDRTLSGANRSDFQNRMPFPSDSTDAMPVRTATELSTSLKDAQAAVRQRATDYGLDFFETIFEVLDFDTMNQLAAYGGFPVRYPHWHWGMEYEKLRKRDAYGLGRIYEMVINNDPCYAYLQESNSVTEQTLVMAHVYGHCDFFKCNAWFSKTDRRMMDQTANHATRVQKYAERFGLTEVERFLDTCLSIEHLIDPYSPFVKRADDPELRPLSRDDSADSLREGWSPQRLPAKDYMERFVNPPAVMKAQQDAHDAEELRARDRFPARPTRDILLFLMRHAPLTDWQRDVLSILRDEAYYFAPQAMTKIMNEGWATYWHRRIMTKKVLTDSEVIDYAETMSGTLQSAGTSLNPYQLGLALWEDLEERWNTGRHGLEFDRCDDVETKRRWNTGAMAGRDKVFEVRRLHCDVTFIDEFLTEDFCHREKLFLYGWNPRTQRKELLSRDFKQVKAQLLRQLTNGGHPVIDVVDSNHRNRGELVLEHKWEQSDLRDDYAKATLENIRRIWTRPVRLLTRQGEKSVAYVADAEGVRLEDN